MAVHTRKSNNDNYTAELVWRHLANQTWNTRNSLWDEIPRTWHHSFCHPSCV